MASFKQKIFDEYCEERKFGNFEELIDSLLSTGIEKEEFIYSVYEMVDLVQLEQQKVIANNAKMSYHNGHFKTNEDTVYVQLGADNVTINESSIISDSNLI